MPEQLAGDRAALKIAWDDLSRADLGSLAESAHAELDRSSGRLRLRLMDRVCEIDPGARSMAYSDDGSQVKPHVQVLLLHYLLGADRSEPTGNMVTFREFTGGALYYPAYRKRTIDFLISRFGKDPEALRRAGERIGGVPLGKGSASFRVQFLPKIAVDLLLWEGDEEVPASANILFDECAGRILTTEGVTVVAGTLCSRVVALSGK